MASEVCATAWKILHYGIASVVVGVVGGLTGLLLNFFVFSHGTPVWVWAIVVGATLIVAPVRAFHETRIELETYRPSVQFDAPAHWAYEWIAEQSKWGKGQEPLEIAKVMHQRARDGVLYVWGQPSTNSFSDEDRAWELIEPTYWRDYRFENTRLIFLEDDATTDSIGNLPILRLYQSLKINRRQVKCIWRQKWQLPKRIRNVFG